MDPTITILAVLCLLLLALLLRVYVLYERGQKELLDKLRELALAKLDARNSQDRLDDAQREHEADLTSIHQLHHEAMEQAKKDQTAAAVAIAELERENNRLIARAAVKEAHG